MKENKPLQQLNGRTGGFYFAVTIALYVILSFVGQAIMGAVAEKTSTVYLAVCSTFSAVSFFIVIAYALFFAKQPTKCIVGQSFGLKFIPLAIILSCGMFLGLGYVNNAIAEVFIGWGANIKSPLDEITIDLGKLIVFSITVALLPAISEELFFRGIILNSLSGVKQVYAVLISALCFALYHCSVAQLVYQFIYGVALGFLFITVKSVLPCIIAHFANNFSVLLLRYLKVEINLYSLTIIMIGVACLAVFSALVYLLLKKGKKQEKEIKTEKGEITRFFFPYAMFAIIICVALAIGSLVG
ncbi:MAG: CPBP family intramembrane metalloprotease [Clostridia bacterium]|nr:CPBP family intramembrane metalloprotease [Clostridia bacterium]